MSLADLRKPQPKVDRSKWPAWVRIPLWGLDTRASAMVFLWVSIVLLLGFIALGFYNPMFFGGCVMVIAVVGNYRAIRWVDKNSRWS